MKSRHFWALLGSAALIGLCAGVPAASAAVFNDPTWPCVQRKVDSLSLGLMWSRPVDTAAAVGVDLSPEVEDLVDQLALRRLTLEELNGLVAAFAISNPEVNEPIYEQVFERIFNELGAKRHKIIKGIERYSLKQIALSEKIDSIRAEMDKLLGESSPDYDKIDKLEEQLDWEERIYQERSRSLTYVCETPVLIEKRLYGIAQMLMKAAAK